MPDLALSVTLERALLGQGPLELNDHVTYYCAPQFLGAAVQWQRQQVTSPFTDGAVTVNRYRQLVSEQLVVEVIAESGTALQAALGELVSAFLQDNFRLTVVSDGATYTYACETSDYQVTWSGPRMIARRAQVTLTVPRQPVPLDAGGVI